MSGDKWETFDNILKDESNEISEVAKSKSTAIAPVDELGDALEKAKQLINISDTTDIPTLVQKMREQFITNRLDTATKSEKAVNMTLTRLIEKLNTEDMPVNTLLKVLTQLRECSTQDMSAMLGVPNPNDPRKGGGAVINILNNNSGGQPVQQEQTTVASQPTVNASSDISKFLEVSTLALENIRSGKVQASDNVKAIVDADFTEVSNNDESK